MATGVNMRVGDLVRLNTEIYVDELNRIGVIVDKVFGRVTVRWINCDFGGAIYRRGQLELICK